MEKVALITGSSSGIGYETAVIMARKGYFTFASMRNIKKGSNLQALAKKEKLPLKVIQLDVTKDASVNKAVRQILKEKGKIDVLVNNAGYLLFGCFEDIALEELKAQFETNFFGIARVTRAVLPAMRKQKRGIIINVSSVAGRIGIPISSGHASSEFAIEGLSESMRYELAPFGIHVSLVEPGMVRSNFIKSAAIARNAKKSSSPYYKVTQKLIDSIRQMTELGTHPEEVAQVILKVAESDPPLPRYVVGNDTAMILESRKSMADNEFESFVKNTILNI